ncbi:MAG: NAD(P)H-dependent oxidoreductase [Treponema sp.]|jgi:flavodoxin|nr:NAD(P)H-dependent oxidoreductase [Treponema sp.]
MKTGVIYFSYEGNCRLIAEQINAVVHGDILALQLEEDKPRKGLAKYVWGGRQVILNQRPALKPYTFDSTAYDLLIIGTPVWAGSPTPALDTFLEQTRITGKQVALFCCCAGSKGKVFDKLKRSLPGNTFVGEMVFINPAKQDTGALATRIRLWLEELSVQANPYTKEGSLH